MQPGHVLAERLHGPDAFFVALHLADFAADGDVPVGRAGDDHLADQKEVIQRIEGMDGAGAADGDDGRAHLAAKHAAIGL